MRLCVNVAIENLFPTCSTLFDLCAAPCVSHLVAVNTLASSPTPKFLQFLTRLGLFERPCQRCDSISKVHFFDAESKGQRFWNRELLTMQGTCLRRSTVWGSSLAHDTITQLGPCRKGMPQLRLLTIRCVHREYRQRIEHLGEDCASHSVVLVLNPYKRCRW